MGGWVAGSSCFCTRSFSVDDFSSFDFAILLSFLLFHFTRDDTTPLTSSAVCAQHDPKKKEGVGQVES